MTVVITGFARTPMGSFQGSLSSVNCPDLGAAAIRAAVERSGINNDQVEQVVMGCVLPAGIGQAPARQAALNAGLPQSTGCTTINKMCGSGMQAMMMAHDSLATGSADIMVAGGMENMSQAPYVVPKARAGLRMGHATMLDHMFHDGLQDSFGDGLMMGGYAERTAAKYGFSREAQDQFAIRSLARAKQANEDGSFDAEITPVTVTTRKGEVVIRHDEQPLSADPSKVPLLKPAFDKNGTVTPANSSSISDGAAAVVMMTEQHAQQQNIKPIAKIVAHATAAQAPEWFTTAPVGAIEKVLVKIGWEKDQVDLWEVNEAFAVVTMAAMQDIGIPEDQVNIHGGACALGHPVGASGARICATLIAALQKTGGKRGVAALCIGGGEATAIAIELCK